MVNLLEEELRRLSSDQDKNEELIKAKEIELARAREELAIFSEELEEANIVLSEYICPHCGAGLSEKSYGVEYYEDEDL